MENPKPNAINIVHIENINSRPYLKISGNCIFDSGLLPNRPLIAEIYDEKIVIRPVSEHKNFKIFIKT